MSEIVGKSIEEIREISPDVGSMKTRDLCYLVAVAVDQILIFNTCSAMHNPHKFCSFKEDPEPPFEVWFNYTLSAGHAWLLLALMPEPVVITKKCTSGDGYNKGDLEVTYGKDIYIVDRPKKAITKAAAELALQGHDLWEGHYE